MMNRTRTISRTLLLHLSAALLMSTVWSGCESADEEQAVLSVVTEGITLLEDTEARQALRLTTSEFVAHPGKLDKAAVLRRLASFYHAHGALEILHPAPEIEIRAGGDTALVTVPFVVATRSVSSTAIDALDALRDDTSAWEEKARAYTAVEQAEISFVKENDRWLVEAIRF